MPTPNLILDSDSYKLSHYLQFPADTQAISACLEARGHSQWPEIVFFGLQAFLTEQFCRPVTGAMIDEAEDVARMTGLPFNRDGWDYILTQHRGLLPLRISALPEGTVVRRGVPMLEVVNTDPALAWLAPYFETTLLRAVWYPTTVASLAKKLKEAIAPCYERSVEDAAEKLPLAVHDFGARSASSAESAALGGMAHLLFFHRSDNLPAILAARQLYKAPMAGLSYPGSEHAVMTAWPQAGEAEAMSSILERFQTYPEVSLVCDSYDLTMAVAETIGQQLKAQIAGMPARLIVRPDSGDPVDTPIRVVNQLAYAFGTTLNAKGHKVLNHGLQVLQGDGATTEDMLRILGRLEAAGFAADSIIFGIGSRLLQKVSRDTFSLALKANARQDADGRWHDMAKRPATMGEKTSRAGRVAVLDLPGGLVGTRLEDRGNRESCLKPVFENGRLLVEDDLGAIAARANIRYGF